MKTKQGRSAGFTLFESLVAVAAMAIVGVVIYSILNGGLLSFARNQALNITADKSRVSLDTLFRQVEQAVDVPELVQLTIVSGSNRLVASGASTSNAIRFVQMKSGTFLITGPVSSTVGNGAASLSYTSATATTLDLEYVPGVGGDGAQVPVAGDRVVLLMPNDFSETISSGASPGKKHGRGIASVSTPTTQANGNKKVTVTLTSSVGKPVLCNNPCYIGREVAFVARDVNGRRELHYLPSTSTVSLNGKTLITNDVDSAPIAAPFSISTVSANDKRLNVRLPVRSGDYSATLSRFKSKDEFNSYLLTLTQIPIRNRNFVPTLSQLP